MFKVGGGSNKYLQSGIPKIAYDYEVGSNSSDDVDLMKIGLMYVSDFAFAASDEYWNTILVLYYNSKEDNWMYSESDEWTISRDSSDSDNRYVYFITYCYIGGYGEAYYDMDIRPCFYLTSSTEYVSGSGTSTDPIRLSVN